MKKSNIQSTKILVPLTLYNSYKRQSELYQQLLSQRSTKGETDPALASTEPVAGSSTHNHKTPPTELLGNGVLEDSSESESSHDSEREYNLETLALKNESNRGLKDKFQKEAPPIVSNLQEEPTQPTTVATKRPHQHLVKTPNHEHHVHKVWKQYQAKGNKLLLALQKHRSVIDWNQEGDIRIRGKKINCQWKDVLPALFQRINRKKIPAEINSVLEVLCHLNLEHFIKRDDLVRKKRFNWHYLNY